MVIIYCPCPSFAEAKRLGGALLDAKLAGCINILPGMVSLYDWKGAREEANEAVLIAKTSIGAAGRAGEIPGTRPPLRGAGDPDAAAFRRERALPGLAARRNFSRVNAGDTATREPESRLSRAPTAPRPCFISPA
jgi:hypothetical protein